jgi:hypothetical protein
LRALPDPIPAQMAKGDDGIIVRRRRAVPSRHHLLQSRRRSTIVLEATAGISRVGLTADGSRNKGPRRLRHRREAFEGCGEQRMTRAPPTRAAGVLLSKSPQGRNRPQNGRGVPRTGAIPTVAHGFRPTVSAPVCVMGSPEPGRSAVVVPWRQGTSATECSVCPAPGVGRRSRVREKKGTTSDRAPARWAAGRVVAGTAVPGAAPPRGGPAKSDPAASPGDVTGCAAKPKPAGRHR